MARLLKARGLDFDRTIRQMKGQARTALKAALPFLEPYRNLNNFELMGLDFLLDESGRSYLLEINENPSLCTNCSLLARVIGGVLDWTLKAVLEGSPGPSASPLFEWASL